MSIRVLPQTLINQIAAGEVVERPASALKELIENAIDAGSTQIDVTLIDGGKTYFSVSDNGKGMTPNELELAVERHATSKLPDEDLFNINFLGFRGEALPSIGSVAKLTLISRTKEASEAWSITVAGGQKEIPKPAAHTTGTLVEVRDLFYATPARLKFLKAPQTEMTYAKEVVNRLAMAYPEIGFSVSDDRRTLLNYPKTDSLLGRVSTVIGKDFKSNAVPVEGEYNGVKLLGFVGLPTYVRATSSEQYLFVNGRFVKDKMVLGAVRGAYQGLIGHGSDGYPVLALFLDVPHEMVDVNVHPAKTEVRFQDAASIRGLLVGAIRNSLSEYGHKTSTTIGIGALGKSMPSILSSGAFGGRNYIPSNAPLQEMMRLNDAYSVKTQAQEYINISETNYVSIPGAIPTYPIQDTPTDFPPLGFAKAQVKDTYIVAQNLDSLILVDQHAAHERLTYEKLMENVGQKPVTQLLLIPEIIDLKQDEVSLLMDWREQLENLGLVIDSFGLDSVAVREIPALLGQTNVAELVQDLTDTLKEFEDTVTLQDKLKDICARMACHGSIRAGRKLTPDEMNALLRQMEKCGTSGQCIHGRPTYIELNFGEIEKLFGRKK